MARIIRWLAITFVLVSSLSTVAPVAATEFAASEFQTVWEQTDKPVRDFGVSRTWMWGPQPNTGPVTEPFEDPLAASNQRTVQYFDKSRMELGVPQGTDFWLVTNGLLAEELISGNLQLGVAKFEQHSPAEIGVTGDPGDPTVPTYATFNPLRSAAPLATGSTITQTLDRNGHVGNDPGLSGYGVTAREHVSEKNHVVASPFWDFMNSSGPFYANGELVDHPLFQSPYYATGFPITDAYWMRETVAGVTKWVLVQAFERRVLTYTPDNPDGWKVESGNVGQHYYQWRHSAPAAANPPVASPSPKPSETPSETMLYHSSLTDWPAFNQNGDSGFVSGGTYHIRAATERFPRVKAHDLNFTDSTVSVDVRMVSQSQKAGACLFTRLVGQDTAHYALCMAADGKAQASYDYVDAQNNPQTQVLLPAKQYGGTLPANQWNTLKITAKGNSLSFFINGTLMGTATTPAGGPASGNIGIGVGNADSNPAEYEFRELVVYGPIKSIVAPSASPTPSSSPVANGPQQGVHPGAFCSPQGATGVTVDGTPMVCTTTPTDDRTRWRAS